VYNLFRFFVRYYVLLLFLLLEIFSLYLVYKNNGYNQTAYAHVANDISGKMFNTYGNVAGYFYLNRTNDSLAQENIRLRAALIESKLDNRIEVGQESDSSKKFVQKYSYTHARVSYATVNRPVNFIYLDKGLAHGIKKQMGVISPNGIVGQVVSVTENYAAVMTIISKDFRVSAKFKKNDYFGNLHWTGTNPRVAALEEIPKHVPVKVGDTLVTSGYSQLFPRNVMVGIIKKVEAQAEKNFLDIDVQLSTDFGNLTHVYVINNMYKEEFVTLDTLTGIKPKP
jgi:rod shape-determining protein MreC